jgi:hypothetical protein
MNRLVDVDEIMYGDDYIVGDLDSVLLNPLALTTPK